MKHVKVLGVPFHHGQRHQGVSKSPEVLRQRGLLEEIRKILPCSDLGDLHFPETDEVCSFSNQLIDRKISHLDLEDSFLLNLGGDHGMALGCIHGILHHRPETIVVWADAHGDVNTPESSTSGNFHGMPLAFLLGLHQRSGEFKWIKQRLISQRLIYFGPRDLDPAEKKTIEDLGITYFSSEAINTWGARQLLQKAFARVDPEGVLPIHVSFDVDVLDPAELSSTGTRVEEGAALEEVKEMLRFLAETQRLKSMDVVELNIDLGQRDEAEKNIALVMDLILLTMKGLAQVEHSIARVS
jgi:arginase